MSFILHRRTRPEISANPSKIEDEDDLGSRNPKDQHYSPHTQFDSFALGACNFAVKMLRRASNRRPKKPSDLLALAGIQGRRLASLQPPTALTYAPPSEPVEKNELA